ncbi:MAG: hypothetical protein O3C52_06940 [Proteobacteria bacterium]|nr:hypothetical protein [Pseudomonadota bacterium]MDA0914026.1 hypothetical protein [Pseudomonadota bacterium]MDA1033088.1 hypothetical protein [Pseudomonadota bacterium]
MTRKHKREALKDRIAVAQARFSDHTPEEIAADAAGATFDFAKKNPLVVIVGAVVLGLTLGNLSRRGRKVATTGGILARIATDAAIGFALAMYQKTNHVPKEVGLAKGQDLIEKQKSDQE